MKTRFAGLFIVASLVVALLSACGGGGGGGDGVNPGSGGGGGGATPPAQPTTVTVDCPDGTKASGATAADANNACPAPKLVSITPADGDKTVSPDDFTGITVATSSKLDPASVNSTTVKLMIGTSTTIAGNVSMTSDGKGFRFVPTTYLYYGQVYDKFTATVKDTLGKILAITSSFTTIPVRCLAPNVWDGTNCAPPTTPSWWPPAVIHPIGEKVIGANTLPAASTAIGDAAWQQALKDGTIKPVDTGAIMTGFSTRPIVWMFFNKILSDVNGIPGNNLTVYCVTPVYKDNGGAIGSFTSPGSVCNTEVIDWVIGANEGIIRYAPGRNQCYEYKWNAGASVFDDPLVTCPQ